MRARPPPNYLAGYPPALVDQVNALIAAGRLGPTLLAKYPLAHAIRTDRALYDYVLAMKDEFMRNAGQLSKVMFDSRLQVIGHALGTHATVPTVQGAKLRVRREIRVASLFREGPPEFLRMIVAHELAHIKERAHDKAFYQLCCHMEPAYHQFEFDLRSYLCFLAAGGHALWPVAGQPSVSALGEQ